MVNSATSKSCSLQQPPSYLCWRDRKTEINDAIANAFNSISNQTKSNWGLFNGCESYNLAYIKEHKLMKKLIQDRSPETKDFYALDVGSGNFEWGRGLAKYLNARKDLPKDATIHIIGVRGEKNFNKEVTEQGQCKLYEFGQFQV